MVGRESEKHLRLKRKVADILRSYGYLVAGDGLYSDDEFAVIRDSYSPPYYCDLCASNGTRVLIIEIDGPINHSSYRRLRKDMHRTNELKSLIKDIEVFRFAFYQLTPFTNETEKLIAEELGLELSNNSCSPVKTIINPLRRTTTLPKAEEISAGTGQQ